MTKTKDKSSKRDKNSVKYISPLNRLCNSVLPDHQMSDGSSGYNVSPVSEVKIAFPTNHEDSTRQLISLDNGLNDENDANEQPPLPQDPPPRAEAVGDVSNIQDFMKSGLLSLGKEIAAGFAKSIANLDTSIKGGFDSLRDRLEDGEYYEPEEGEVRDEGDDGPEMPDITDDVHDIGIVPLASLSAAIVKDDGRGPKIDQKLSKNVEHLMRIKPDEEMQKTVFENIKQPLGCEGLAQVSVNTSIWEKMTNEARGHDIRLQKVQLAIIKGTTEVVRMYDELLKLVKEGIEVEKVSKVLEIGNNALICLGAGNVELVQRRREAIRPGFEASYSHLFNATMPFTDALFGNELTKSIKDITEDNKMLNSVVKSQRGASRGRFMSRGNRGRASASSSNYQRSYPSYNASYSGRGTTSRGRQQSFSQERAYKRPYSVREPQNYKRGRQRRN